MIWQEASCRCAFCKEDRVPLLDIHHIVSRAAGGPNDLANLILVCKNCHALIESGSYSPDEIVRRKQDIRVIPLFPPRADPVQNIQIQGDVKSSVVANSITFNASSTRPRMSHPDGSIGAVLPKKNYISHLITRYHDFRKADQSYGRIVDYHHSVIHKQIERKFKMKTYFIPTSRFEDLAVYLQKQIDGTIQGRCNRKAGTKNYSSFDDYVQQIEPT